MSITELHRIQLVIWFIDTSTYLWTEDTVVTTVVNAETCDGFWLPAKFVFLVGFTFLPILFPTPIEVNNLVNGDSPTKEDSWQLHYMSKFRCDVASGGIS